jgi:hypothetical protein
MKSLLTFSIIIFVSFLFSGCPYSSNVPVDKPNIKVESKFFGKWIDPKGTNSGFAVNKLNDFEYRIAQIPNQSTNEDLEESNDTKRPGNDKETADTTIYTGHISKIKDFYFLNLIQTSENALTSGEYDIYRIEFMNDNEIKLTEITSNIKEQFSNSSDLRNYIEKYMDSGISFFYGSETTYIKEK